jgi:hypothetical protein
MESAVHSRPAKYLRKTLGALVGAATLLAGCHGNNNVSGYGIAWVSLTEEPAPEYTSYIVTVDTVTLTRDDGAMVSVVGTPEIVDFAQLHNVAELWSSGAIPVGTYVSATITLDYTNASISVLANGGPQAATVLDYATRKAPTTYAITVNFDAQHQPTFTPTYASTSAALLALDMDLEASGEVSYATATPTVYVRPIISVGYLPSDTKLIRVRGPLINSSSDVSTYTVYIRPFYDEANNIGSVTLFSQPNTVYTINGKSYLGPAGLQQLSTLSAGTTMTAGYTTFEPDFNPLNGAAAGRFNLAYVIGGSTLEDVYTEGISGDVIARNGDTLTLLGSTLFLNTADTFSYTLRQSQVLIGPNTIVTADDNKALTSLTTNSIAVGQHITARGRCVYATAACSATSTSDTVLDATGNSSANTGSVRIQPSEIFGTVISSAPGNLVMDVQSINGWQYFAYDFSGNGATTPDPHAFSIDTAGITVPAGIAAGDPLWVSGYSTPFGTAPPDAQAFAVNTESSVQVAGAQADGGIPTTPGTETCAVGSQVCEPAVMQAIWSSPPGTEAPFASVSGLHFTINLGNVELSSAIIHIGTEVIDMRSLPASPLVVPTSLPATKTFAPRYLWGNQSTSTTSVTGVASTTAFKESGNFDVFIEGVLGTLNAENPALQMAARGLYNRTTNTFTATAIDFVL